MKDFKKSYQKETDRLVYGEEKRAGLLSRVLDAGEPNREEKKSAENRPSAAPEDREDVILIKEPGRSERIRHAAAGLAAVFAAVLLAAGGIRMISKGGPSGEGKKITGEAVTPALPSSAPQEEERGARKKAGVGLAEQAQELAREFTEYCSEVYAPDILYASPEQAVFYDYRALFIYSFQEGRLTGAVDLQELDLNYFDDLNFEEAGGMETKLYVARDGKSLLAYNGSRDGKSAPAEGFLFELEGAGGEFVKLEPEKVSAEDVKQFPAVIPGESFQEENGCYYGDTFELFTDFCDSLKKKEGPGGQYSRQTFLFTPEEGKQRAVFLCNPEDESRKGLKILVHDMSSGKEAEYPVFQEIENKENEILPLPPYRHQSADPDEELLYAAIAQEMDYGISAGEGDVIIPSPVLVDRFEEDGYLKLFVMDGWGLLRPYGDTLMELAGGYSPCVYYFEKKDGSYVYAAKEKAEDGAGYPGSIRRFCEGHEETAEKLLADSFENNREVLLANLGAYVRDNGLSYRYWKQYGWGKIEIPVDK